MTLFRFMGFALLFAASNLCSAQRNVENASPTPTISRIDSLNNLAFEIHLTEPDRAITLAYEAIGDAQQILYKAGEAQGYRQVGLVAWAQGNYSYAQKNFIAALRIAEQSGAQQLIADITGNIGLVYFAIGDLIQARQHHQQSLLLHRKAGNVVREAVALNNLGDVYRKLHTFDSAIQCYSQAYNLRKNANNVAGMATNIRNIGNVYEEKGDYGKALAHYQRSMRLADSLDEKRGMSQCRMSLASTYFKMKDFRNARKYALESISISDSARFRAFLRDGYKLLSEIHEAQESKNEALAFFKLYAAYRDSVVNLQIAGEVSSLRLGYENEKKQAEIDLLKKEQELKASEIGKQNTILLSTAVTLVLMTVLAFSVFRNYMRQKETNRALSQKNQEIAQQHLEIARQRDELIALNEEITAQQEDLVASRDALEHRNIAIAKMNEQITDINHNLERIIQERTRALEKQNEQLMEYAFINAHKLRAPIARIQGLAQLLTIKMDAEEQQKILGLLNDCALDLDRVTRSINEVIQDGITAHPKK